MCDTKYHKIQSVYKRDGKGRFTEEYSTPEIQFLAGMDWHWFEKVDGTNMRIIVEDDITFRGRTDAATPHPLLLHKLDEITKNSGLRSMFPDGAVLYGEGIGPKIQKGRYPDHGWNFILFDVFCGGNWLRHEDVSTIAESLEMLRAPHVGTATIHVAEDYVRQGTLESAFGPVSEGLVLIPAVPLLDRRGARIITKLKTKDYDRA